MTQPIEEADAQTDAMLERVVLAEVERLTASAAPGQAAVSTAYLALAHLKRSQLMDCAGQIARVVLKLAEVAIEPGSQATAASGMFRETMVDAGAAGRWNLQPDDVKPPLGFDFVRYTRLVEGDGMEAIWLGGNNRTIYGAGLDTTAKRITEKAAALSRWPTGYDEQWLLVASLSHSQTSVQQARLDKQRFPDTGFDKIWLIDTLRSIEKAGEDLPVNVCRLDIHED